MARVEKSFTPIPNDRVEVIDETNMYEQAKKLAEENGMSDLDGLMDVLAKNMKLPIGAIYRGNHWEFHASDWKQNDFTKALHMLPVSIAVYLTQISEESQGNVVVEQGMLSLIVGIKSAFDMLADMGIDGFREESGALYRNVCHAIDAFLRSIRKHEGAKER